MALIQFRLSGDALKRLSYDAEVLDTNLNMTAKYIIEKSYVTDQANIENTLKATVRTLTILQRAIAESLPEDQCAKILDSAAGDEREMLKKLLPHRG